MSIRFSIEQLKAEFLENIKDHEMTVVSDNGVNRVINFSRNGSSVYGFTLVTWAGHLSISGDVSDYTFRRLHDMFDFFGSDDELSINPGYWGEKLTSIATNGGYREFSEEKFKAALDEAFDDQVDDLEIDCESEEFDDLLHEFGNLKDSADEYSDGHICVKEVMEFIHKTSKGDVCFPDFYENNLDQYTHGYIYSLLCIVWGIRKYKETMAEV